MTKGKVNIFERNFPDLRSVERDDMIAFANLKLSEKLWEQLVAAPFSPPADGEGGDLPDLDWLIWAWEGKRRVRRELDLENARKLQRELREVLALIAGGKAQAVAKRINDAGPYAASLSVSVPPREDCSQLTKQGAPARGWKTRWKPEGAEVPRQVVTLRLVQALAYARDVGRCASCKHFFVKQRERLQRFCSKRCSDQAQNKRRAKAGNYTKEKREQRARANRQKRGLIGASRVAPAETP